MQPWKPWSGQKKAVRYLLEHAAAGLLLEPGFGKTSIALAAFKVLQQKKIARRALVVAPLRPMQLVWAQEAAKWQDFAHFKVVALHGDYGKKEELLEQDADIYLINYEGLKWLMGDNYYYKRLGADTLIIDELSKLKHTNTQRFKTLKPALSTFARRWGLTGSPAANGYMDLFGQAYCLDQGRTLGRYITHYRMRYFTPGGYGGYEWTLRDGAEAEIQAAVKPLFLRLDITDYIDVPQIVDAPLYVDLPPAARRVYDAMEEEMWAELDVAAGTRAVAESAAAVSGKCRQIANGSVYVEGLTVTNKPNVSVIHTAKIEALRELLEELQGAPLFLAYQFKHDLAALQREFGADLPYIGGGVTGRRVKEIEADWNADRLPLLAAQTASVAHGVNLQGGTCCHVAWFGETWNYEDYDQFIKRIARQGSKARRVFNHPIRARNTVDAVLAVALASKATTQNDLLQALQTYRVKRR